MNFPMSRHLHGKGFFVLLGKARTKLAGHARPSTPWLRVNMISFDAKLERRLNHLSD